LKAVIGPRGEHVARRRERKKKKRRKSVIKNYGLMWNRDEVLWGRGRRKGALLGRRSGQVIDFREQIGVYVLYDEGRHPVYVGQAGRGNARLFNRLVSHKSDSLADRWRYFSWFGLLVVNKSKKLSKWDDKAKRVTGTIASSLDEIEGVLIAATEPPFNKQGAKFSGIKRFQQEKPDETGDDPLSELPRLIKKMGKKIDKLLSR
jgi:hypothetical protein